MLIKNLDNKKQNGFEKCNSCRIRIKVFSTVSGCRRQQPVISSKVLASSTFYTHPIMDLYELLSMRCDFLLVALTTTLKKYSLQGCHYSLTTEMTTV